MQLAIADVDSAAKFVGEHAQECVSALRRERLREPHDLIELGVGKTKRQVV
jgi:hypothetical protein